MFTIKFYSADGNRQLIQEAKSFTVLRGGGDAEITLHRDNQNDDARYDLKADPEGAWPPRFAKAIIENSAGRTTEIIHCGPAVQGVLPKSKDFGKAQFEMSPAVFEMSMSPAPF